MGLYNIIKQKRGTKEEPATEEGAAKELDKDMAQADEFSQSLVKDFKGVMRLYGSKNGKACSAALFIENGDITGASFDDPNGKKTVYGSEAIENIKKKLPGTQGDLEVYCFKEEEDMEKARKNNQSSLLACVIPFSTLGMKIKSREEDTPEGEEPKDRETRDYFAITGRAKPMKVEESFDLADFARKFSIKLSPEGRDMHAIEREVADSGLEADEEPPEAKKFLGIGLVDPKRERLAELKKKRQIEDQELMKKMSQITTKKPETGVANVKKVETSIDKLYQMVLQHKRLRIDNDLAAHLGVSRAQIENWAMILEEHNLVELHYPAIGEPEIRKLGEKS